MVKPVESCPPIKRKIVPKKNWHKEYNLPDEYEHEGYLDEQIVSKMRNNLQLSSYCSANCIFCCNKMGPLETLVLPFRSIDSIKRGLDFIDGDYSDKIGLRLFRRLSEGESILHPKLFEILGLIREKFPEHEIQLETNGSTLKPNILKELSRFKPLTICLSYHSHNPENWSKITGLPKELHENPKRAFLNAKLLGLTIEPTLSPVPNLTGYSDIENTIAFISKFNNEMEMTLPCYTKELPEELKSTLHSDFFDLVDFAERMEKKYSIKINCDPDTRKPIVFYPRHVIQKTIKSGHKNVVWMMSECAYARAKVVLDSEKKTNNHFVKLVKNTVYGGNCITSGLLQVEDFRLALREMISLLGFTPELVLLPSVCFDLKGNDLCGEHYSVLESEFSTKIWIIADQRDYDVYRIDGSLSSQEKLELQTYLKYQDSEKTNEC